MVSNSCVPGKFLKWWILFILACVVYVQYMAHQVCVPALNQDIQDRVVVRLTAEPVISPGPQCPVPLQRTYNISCAKLLKGNPEYMKSLQPYQFHRLNGSCDLSSLVGNCSIISLLHGYKGKFVTKEELEFPLAFGIKIHKDPIQAEQLLRTIYRPHNVYCIHIDLKAGKEVSDPFRKLAKCFDNVFVLQMYRVIYSSIRQPLSDLACMKKVISTNVNWKYYLILAGQEFVIKSNLEIVQILKEMNGTNDIELYPFPKHEMKRFKFKHPIKNDHIQKFSNSKKSPFPYNITIYKGSSYAMMSRDFVKFILTSNISKDLFKWAEDMYAPEEMIWATLNALPGAPGGYKVHVKYINDQFISRATIWQQYKQPCHGKYVRWICIFSYKDLPWLVSAPEVVANKFHSDYDQLVVDCLEEWLQNKTRLGQTLNMNWYHYRNVPHIKMKLS